MLKDYMKDYIGLYRPSRIKQDCKESQSTSIAIFFAFIWMTGETIIESDGSLWSELIILWTMCFPMGLAVFAGRGHSVKRSKMMYLCPMDKKERRDYLYGTYFFRIGLHMILAVIGICVLISFFNCDLLSAVEILLNDLVIAIGIIPEQKTDYEWKVLVLNASMFVIAVFSNLAQLVFISNEGSYMFGKVMILLFFCFIQLPLMLKYRKYVKRELDAAVMFEGGRE